MDNLLEEWSYPAGRIGKQVQIFDCVDSTNTRAMELSVDPEYHGAVIVAQRQTSGAGNMAGPGNARAIAEFSCRCCCFRRRRCDNLPS